MLACSPWSLLVLCGVLSCGSFGRDGQPYGGAPGGSATTGDDDVPDDPLDTDESSGALTHADDSAGDPDSDSTTGRPDGTSGDDPGGETSDGNGTGAGDTGGPPAPDCPAHCYCEPIDPDADVSDLESGYQSGNWAPTMLELLGRRWPAGRDLLVWAQAEDAYFGAFADTSSFTNLMDSVMTEVHEGTHGWDYAHATVNDFSYYLREDLTFTPPKIHAFDRGEIYGMVEGSSTDLYDGTYLTGTQGTYGFYELLDEGNCYINGMGGVAVVGEFIPWGMSGREGAVAFMYYLELYLRRARTMYPDLYAELEATPEYIELVRTQWLRMHFLLQYADEHPHMGIHDEEIRALMYEPENQDEIEMFIDHELAASNCLP
jgi:hypothetical protein